MMLIKKIVLVVVYYLFPWLRSTRGTVVLTYHRIPDTPHLDDSMKVSVKVFEQQIRFLKDHYRILSAGQVADLIQAGKAFPDKACLITFDDGWRDNYTNAYPVLKKHDVPALIFLSTDYVGTLRAFWPEKLAELLTAMPVGFNPSGHEDATASWPDQLKRQLSDIASTRSGGRYTMIQDLVNDLKRFGPAEIDRIIDALQSLLALPPSQEQPAVLSWQEVEEMANNRIAFGSHTKSHAILTQLPDARIAEELRESRECIEKRIGQSVHFLAYPNGNHNRRVIEAARSAGYRGAFTCLPGNNAEATHAFELKRTHIREDFTLGFDGAFSELFFTIQLVGIRRRLSRLAGPTSVYRNDSSSPAHV